MLKTLKEIASSFICIAVLLPVLIWLAIFSYISIYYSYIPELHFERPVHLLRSSCNRYENKNENRKSCGSLSSIVPFVEGHFQPGVDYSIYLELLVPESEINCMIGMFEVELQMRSKDGNTIMISRRSAMLEYKSWLYKNLETFLFLPLYISTGRRQMQTLTVSMTDDFQEDTYSRSYDSIVSVHHHKVEVYSSSLHAYARFSGIRYFMYSWPLTTATFGILTSLVFLSVVATITWLTYSRLTTNHTKPAVPPPPPIKMEGEVDEDIDCQ